MKGQNQQKQQTRDESQQGSSLIAQTVKNLPALQETQVRSLGWEDPLKKEMETHSSILGIGILPTPVEFHGQRSLAGYRPRGHKESDMTEQLTQTNSHKGFNC